MSVDTKKIPWREFATRVAASLAARAVIAVARRLWEVVTSS
jgi:hypothetical protein